VVLRITGVDDLTAALEAMAGRLQAATPKAVEEGAKLLQERTRAKLELTSHPRGTPTPSKPGQPPSKVDGHLRDSVVYTPPAPTGDGGWTCVVGPTTVYSRIQELGGWAGRGHRSHLPARPYLKPSAEELLTDQAFRGAVAQPWAAAIRA
jgi:phage gpG-like protein